MLEAKLTTDWMKDGNGYIAGSSQRGFHFAVEGGVLRHKSLTSVECVRYCGSDWEALHWANRMLKAKKYPSM